MTTTSLARAAVLALAAATALALPACKSATTHVAQFESVATDDYRRRHPIRIAPAPRSLAIEVHRGAKGISPTQAASVRAFAGGYEAHGEGPFVLAVPVGGANAVALEPAAEAVIHTLGQSGIGYVEVQHVPAASAHASVLTLTYHAVGARVENCGLWPADGAMTTSHTNRSYHNFGCATQRNLAAQVANPQDLVQPRATSPAHAGRRYTVMTKYRAGEPTVTTYDTENEVQASSVGQ